MISTFLFQGQIVSGHDRLLTAVNQERRASRLIQGVPAVVDAAGTLGAYQLDGFREHHAGYWWAYFLTKFKDSV